MKDDASMRQESLGLKEQYPSESTLKLQLFTFTNAKFCFSNAMTSAFDDGLMGSRVKNHSYYLLRGINTIIPKGK